MVWGLNGVGDEATEGKEAAKQAVDAGKTVHVDTGFSRGRTQGHL